MRQWLLTPPIAFIIVFFAIWAFSRLFKRISFKGSKCSLDEGKPYACGEEGYDHMAQPDYSNVFPYAFFFTLAHVATLIMTTVPTETLETFAMATLYIIGAVLGLYILFRK